MKKFITDIRTLAALLMAGAAFTACSSDDNIIEQPQNPTEPKVYTLVIKASKGGDTTTRALQPGYDDVLGKNTVDAYWSGTETIEVGQYNYAKEKYDIIGEATAAYSPNGNTTITAELDYAPDPDKDLNFFLGGSTLNFTGQVGLLTGTNSISENYDYASDCLTSGSFTVDEINNKVIPNKNNSRTLEFRAAEQAIIKFTLKDKANNEAISPTAFTVSDGTNTVELTSIPPSTYTANGDGVLYVAFPPGAENTTITLTATVGDDTYTYTTPSTKTFWRGQYYEITVKMNRVVDLSKTSIYKSNVFTAQNGDVLTGTVPEGKAVYVASGAEVTLRNATIDCDWTYALFCWGNNTINLEGTNTARSIDENNTYDGINCYNGALTIQGSGSLTATGCNGGAGITCFDTGSITIKGGTITATGSYNEYGPFGGAGIGGVSSCGDIIIEGGTIEATGGNYAAGIGGGSASNGEMSSCGNITIKSTVTSVTATRGYNAPNSIGAGNNGTCGTVTIEDWSKVTRR